METPNPGGGDPSSDEVTGTVVSRYNICMCSIYGREDQELRDGEEKRGRCNCKTREREEGEMRNEGEGRRGELVMKERRGRDGIERRQSLVTIYLCVAAKSP